MTAPRLELRGITKRYPGTVANDSVDLIVEPGEIHALLGENGAGKSTLVKIIYGLVRPDEGAMLMRGEPVHVTSPNDARQHGIGVVFQHFNLFETLTVAENILLNLDERRDLAALSREIETVATRYRLGLNPHRHVHALSVGERQRVEIIRCLLQNPKLIVLDEPTSVLTPQEVESLFETLRQLAAEGRSILYISHKLEEIRGLCATATILRGGRVSARCVPALETPASLAAMMIGRDLPHVARKDRARPEAVRKALVVDKLSIPAGDPHGVSLSDISFTVRPGEILGIAGVAGNGQRELLLALNGENAAPRAGMIRLGQHDVGRFGPNRRRRLGLGVVPEERIGRGAVSGMSLALNGLLTGHRKGLVGWGIIRRGAVLRFAGNIIRRFDVAATGPHAEARSLSGGNLQKFILGRELMLEPEVLVLGYPTWGVDVGAAATIRQEIVDLRAKGCALVVISEDLDELFELCDRIAVMALGRLSPARETSQASAEELGLWMAGGFPAADEEERGDGLAHTDT